MKKKQEKPKKEENCFVELLKELSFEVVAQTIFSIVWNTILFIPRMIFRFFSSI